MDNLINLIFPPKCLMCSSVGTLVCRICLATCKIVDPDICVVCEKNSILGITHTQCSSKTPVKRFITVFDYDGAVRKVIKTSKYRTKQFLALKLLTKYGVNLLNAETLNYLRNSVLVPIPLNRAKEKARGFNQVDLICKELAFKAGCKIARTVLIRKKETLAQFENDRRARFKNLESAFALSEKARLLPKDTKLVIVDDICTTGATVLEAAKTLNSFGFSDISVFTLSKRFKRT